MSARFKDARRPPAPIIAQLSTLVTASPILPVDVPAALPSLDQGIIAARDYYYRSFYLQDAVLLHLAGAEVNIGQYYNLTNILTLDLILSAIAVVRAIPRRDR